MIKTQTVLVLGAGASCPYGYPSARTLILEIFGASQGGLAQALRDDLVEARECANALLRSNQPSADLFLSRREEYRAVGKQLIVGALIQHEKKRGTIRDVRKGDEWIEYLFRRIEGDPDSFSRNNQVSVVTFNYDRVLEHVLYESFFHSYGLDSQQAMECVRAIPIFHVYGSMLPTDWSDDATPAYGDGGGHTRRDELQAAAQRILIVDEERDPQAKADLLEARRLIVTAEKVCCLGFGYHPQNVHLLGLDRIDRTTTRIYGSAYGLSGIQREEAETLIGGIQLAPSTADARATLELQEILYDKVRRRG